MRFRNLVMLLLAGSIGISAVSQITLNPVSAYSTITLYDSGHLKLGEFSPDGVLTKEPGITEAQVDAAFYKEWTRMRDYTVAVEDANQVKMNVCIAGWQKANDDLRAFATEMQRQLLGISKTLKGSK